jgi:hypothetical protein
VQAASLATNSCLRKPNKALHRTAIPLRSIAACELGRLAPRFYEVGAGGALVELNLLGWAPQAGFARLLRASHLQR